ncbi:hypothetical protein E2C01_042583 [Portunus trituberculatus]|uniref:Uncharacterized protein n=1 Tax=Portunus trituberculatus TaxID=210409 RepID=A0A5B7FM74_PORTR|nr:hypothetical protein [Portunus trituberculatus]
MKCSSQYNCCSSCCSTRVAHLRGRGVKTNNTRGTPQYLVTPPPPPPPPTLPPSSLPSHL